MQLRFWISNGREKRILFSLALFTWDSMRSKMNEAEFEMPNTLYYMFCIDFSFMIFQTKMLNMHFEMNKQ
jgi:hypothetical protein